MEQMWILSNIVKCIHVYLSYYVVTPITIFHGIANYETTHLLTFDLVSNNWVKNPLSDRLYRDPRFLIPRFFFEIWRMIFQYPKKLTSLIFPLRKSPPKNLKLNQSLLFLTIVQYFFHPNSQHKRLQNSFVPLINTHIYIPVAITTVHPIPFCVTQSNHFRAPTQLTHTHKNVDGRKVGEKSATHMVICIWHEPVFP